jgi:hypothetical protein
MGDKTTTYTSNLLSNNRALSKPTPRYGTIFIQTPLSFVDSLFLQEARHHEHVRKHRARGDRHHPAPLLPRRLVDGVVADQRGGVAQQEGDHLLLGRPHWAPQADLQAVRPGHDGQVREAVARQDPPPVPV